MQNSWPASFKGGGVVRRMLPMPLRRVGPVKSVSSVGLSTRATLVAGVGVAAVMDDTPDLLVVVQEPSEV